MGVQRTFLVSHEEVKTLPLYLGKPVGHVDFKYALEPKLVQALVSLRGLGLPDETRRIRVDQTTVPFRRAFQTAFPDLSEISRYLRGTKSVTVEVEGTRGGMRKVLRSHITMSHEGAWRLGKTTAVYYLTGAAAAIGAIFVAEGATPGPGVYPAEVLEPARMFSEMARSPAARLAHGRGISKLDSERLISIVHSDRNVIGPVESKVPNLLRVCRGTLTSGASGVDLPDFTLSESPSGDPRPSEEEPIGTPHTSQGDARGRA